MKKTLYTTCLFLLLFSSAAHAGKVIFVTYYPTPYISYDRIRLVPKTTAFTNPCDIGSIYFDKTSNFLKICGDDNSGQNIGQWNYFYDNIIGDIDLDGVRDLTDANVIKQLINNETVVDFRKKTIPKTTWRADVDQDGILTLADANKITNYITGATTDAPTARIGYFASVQPTMIEYNPLTVNGTTYFNDGLILATGTYVPPPALPDVRATDVRIPTGAGTRFIWEPAKAAFRAGYVDADQWDDANIGDYSVAFGYGNKATGIASTAFGKNNLASGDYATATGNSTTASGTSSFSGGLSSVASGYSAIAIGQTNTASGAYSIAMGHGNIASTQNSIAMGDSNASTGGSFTLALGFETEASNVSSQTVFATPYPSSGPYDGVNRWSGTSYPTSLSSGYQTHSTSNYSMAFGYQTRSEIDAGIASGYKTLATGCSRFTCYAAFAFGYETTSKGKGSFASGYQTTAGSTGVVGNSGQGAVAIGSNTVALNDNTFASGYGTRAEGPVSQAFGYATKAIGFGSKAFGRGITVNGDRSIAFALNDQSASTVIQSDILVVMGGNVGIGKTNPAFLLEVTGAVSPIKTGGGGWSATSDIRLKKNIQPLHGALDKLLRLRGVTFEWIKPEEHGNLTNPQLGFIAQEVEEIFPEWVSTDSNGYKSLTIRGFEALLVESIKDLKHHVDSLREKENFEEFNNQLNNNAETINDLKTKLDQLSKK